MFLGEFEHSLDDKGRLAIPARFRPELGNGVVVTRGIDRCLFVWPPPEWQIISDRLGQMSLMLPDARRLHRLIFAGASQAMPDRLGRILVPSYLRTYADLKDSVVVAGVFNRLEIWDREAWSNEQTLAERDSSQLAEHLFSLGV